MNDEAKELKKNLNIIGSLIDGLEYQKEIKETTEEDYIKSHARRPEEPKKRSIHTFDMPDNAKASSLKITCSVFFLICIVLSAIIMAKSVYRAYVTNAMMQCKEWDVWVNAYWPKSQSFESNSTSWPMVQAGLKAYGLDVSWEDVEYVVINMYSHSGTIYSDYLREYLIDYI